MSDSTPRVLLLTPLGLDGRIWNGFADALARDVGLVIASWPAHGPESERSAGPVEFDPVEEARGVAVAVGPFDLVIAADGDAAAAVDLGRRGHARAVALITPATFRPLPEAPVYDMAERLEEQMARIPEGLVDALREGDFERVGDLVARNLQTHLDDPATDLVRRVVADNAEIIAAGHGLARMRATWPDELSALSVPVLIVGRRDPDRPEDGLPILRALAARCVDGRIDMMDGFTDYPWLEHPDQLLEIISGFLQDAVSRPGDA